MNPDAVKDYVRRTRRIHGWFSPGAASLFALLDHAQREAGVGGNLFEIGVHHGKSAILLGMMTEARDEVLGVCDIFGEQSANVSASGRGDREIFLQNMRAFFPRQDFLRVFEKLSDALTLEEVTTRCRFFHIDGGHNASEALSDLELAAAALVPGGAIVIDDAFHPAWPGVSEAIFRFLDRRGREFAPLAVGFNKLVVVRHEARDLYAKHLDDARTCWRFIPREPYDLKRLELCGSQTYIFYVPSWKSERSLKSRLYQWYFNHPRLKSGVSGGVSALRRAARA